MFCAVYPNGYGVAKGTHISLYVLLMRGEYDDKLKWPFNGVVTIEMFNRQTEKWESIRGIPLDDSIPVYSRRRAVDRASGGVYGYSKWMSLEEIVEKYLLDGVIRFKVTKIELK